MTERVKLNQRNSNPATASRLIESKSSSSSPVYKLELLTNATVVDDAIRFVSGKSNKSAKSSSEGDKEESNEPDYDEDKDQIEEQEEGIEETTTNQIF